VVIVAVPRASIASSVCKQLVQQAR